MTPDAAGRPERSDLTVDQHRMVAPSRVWLMPPLGDPTWYAGTWKSNPLTVVVGDVPYVPESEATRLRAEVEALVPLARLGLNLLDELRAIDVAEGRLGTSLGDDGAVRTINRMECRIRDYGVADYVSLADSPLTIAARALLSKEAL